MISSDTALLYTSLLLMEMLDTKTNILTGPGEALFCSTARMLGLAIFVSFCDISHTLSLINMKIETQKPNNWLYESLNWTGQKRGLSQSV